jgi:predicted metalloprotease with PDZ domain
MRSLYHLPAVLSAAVLTLWGGTSLQAGDLKGVGIDYAVTVPDTKAETFAVSATIRNIPQDTLTFQFPIWAPGAYDIINYGAYVYDFVATDKQGKQLKVVRGDTNTFRIIGAKSPEVKLVYKVKDIESVPNSLWFGLSDIEKDYAFAVGTALFGYPAGYKDIPYTVNYTVPNNWDIAVSLDPLRGSGPHAFQAKNYDELVDAPLQMGKFQRFEFIAGGKPHVVTITAPEPIDDSTAAEFLKMTQKIINIQTAFFGDMPYERYVFQHYLVIPQQGDFAFGALEHAGSSTYRMPYGKGVDVVEELEPIVSHEYWHLWSPKRIHVDKLGPFDYQHPPRTKSLWFHEGLTEYYGRVLLVRNGMTKPEEYIEHLNEVVTPTYGKPQRRAITDLSVNISESDITETTGLYSKGPMLGLLLDAAIRSQTGNSKSLDDAMRYFNNTYGKTGRSFTDDEIVPLIEKATGAHVQEFYNNYIDGRAALPYDSLFPKIGLKMTVTQEKQVRLGAGVQSVDGGWRVNEVEPGGTADSTGLRAGDIMTTLQIGGDDFAEGRLSLTEVPAIAADQLMKQVPTYLPATITVQRDGKEMKLKVKYQTGSVDIHQVAIDENAAAQAKAIRRSMFGF